MSVDAARSERRPERPSAPETRRRLEHARSTGLTQLRALEESGREGDELMSAQRVAVEQVLKEIGAAFARVEDGAYGSCLGCGQTIPDERLEILPYTRYCVPCQRRAAG
ncbi:TraR/DksA C4-type zinc finger protein [Streptomyces sp. NPDC002795]|uniref:TraR/DksA C4-type zinc finger protein n=1 Tax=Streptomyces sp. NPDC002795 TaxID=3364665 RepID=UPI0036A3CBFC